MRQLNGSFEKSLAILMRQKSEWDDTWLRSFLLLGTVWILGVRARYGQNLMASGFGATTMEFIVWVETRLAGKRLEIQEVAKVEREATGIGPEELGLTLADGKTVLKQVQARIVPDPD